MVEEAIEHRGDGRGVAEQPAPVVHGAVGRDEGAGALVAAHDELEEILGRGSRKLAHSEVVQDEQRYARHLGDVALALAVERGVGEFFEQALAGA